MTKIRIGIIGAGGIARDRHIPAFLKMKDNVVVEAVCDVNEITAQAVASQFSIRKWYTDYRELLPHVDAIAICTPNKFHAEIAIAALDSGVHVFCEKPMAMDATEGKAMIEVAHRARKQLQIGYHYRFMKDVQAAKTVIASGEIGEPFVARVQALRRRKVPGWGVFTNKDLQGGGSLIDWGCHFLDMALWLLGNPKPIEVLGKAYNHLSKIPNQINQWGSVNHESFEVDDHVTAYMTFENGASMLFETSWAANIKDDVESISISGTTGGIDLFPFTVNQAKHGMLLNSEANWIAGEEDFGVVQLHNFISSCLGEEEPLVKAEEALQVTSIIDAIYESSEKGTSIKFGEEER